MRIEFLVEDSSGKKLLDEIMKKYIQEMPLFPIEYSIIRELVVWLKVQTAETLKHNSF